MIAFGLNLLLAAAALSQSAPPSAEALASEPAAAHSETAPSTYEADLRCFAVFTVAQGRLRGGDARQDLIAAAMPDVRSRVDGYLASGEHDEAQFLLDFQAATNAATPTFEQDLPACLGDGAVTP